MTDELRANLIAVKGILERGESIYLHRTIAEQVRYKLQTADRMDTVTRHDPLSVYAYLFTPQPRLIIFGANQDAGPLAQLAYSTGFRVIVADWRQGLCENEWFAGIETVCEFPDKLGDELQLTESDFVIVMSHQFQRDQEFLRALAGVPLRYLGIMGSTARTEALLEGLSKPEWLHYPVGERIGSEGPMENAISIMAQLIAIKRGVHKGKARSNSLRESRGLESLGGW
ncbi:XdhC family protein [Paenibacillus hexagrammi]|uniref:XdhC family protein n=1 Tax=Paenibacillus hexagrammi TaxID=2908839 RepID=A0ABY3SFD4_9BACL|nr:XdhC family protein [Paenibacillus sp. YPD9-1]UJF32707.1 XdhC family protein [Paenibacillus sp. YPD9-1]